MSVLSRVASGAFVFALSVGALDAQVQIAEQFHLVEVQVTSGAELDRLLALDLDLAACQALEFPLKRVDVIAHGDADIARMRAAGLTIQVAIRDLASYHARQLAGYGPFAEDALTPPIGQGGMGGNYTLAQMEAILDGFHNDHPTLCSAKASIGRSIEGRDLWVVKISDNVTSNENEARVWFDAVHHAREPVSMSLTLAFMDWVLSNYGTDPVATFLVDEREMYFVPCVNPDGYEYNRTTNPGGGGMWRKNRRNNGDGTFGVDLNRNYATGWSAPNGGNSTSTSSDTYRGTAPFSEPETTAIEAFMTGMGFTQSCSAHTYTDILLHPWGYVSGSPANVAEYSALGARFVDDNGVPFGPVSTSLYIAAGGAVDHHHAVHHAIAWTPELGRSNEGGFWPTPPTQVAIVQRHLSMLRDMALTAGALIEVGDVTVAEDVGGNGDGTVGPGEVGTVAVVVRNDGLVAPAGTVQLTMTSLTTGVTVVAGATTTAAPGRLATTTTTPTALRVQVGAGFADPTATLRIAVTGGGRTTSRDVTFRTAALRVVVADDMEQDRGLARAATDTATTGRFERAVPQLTTSGGATIQPGADHSPNGTLCQVTEARAGTSAGSYDVDNGITDLLTPVVDLSHLAYAELAVWRWYAESVGDDAFEIAVSDDGGNAWTTLLASPTSTGAWVREVLPIPGPLTDRMRFRFRAQDLNASLVEAAIDDLEIHGVAADASVTLWSSGVLGTQLRVGLTGAPQVAVFPLASTARTTPIPIPGVGGALLLDPTTLVALPAVTLDGDGAAGFDVAIPNDPNLRNATLHWQAVQTGAAGWTFGNATAVTFR